MQLLFSFKAQKEIFVRVFEQSYTLLLSAPYYMHASRQSMKESAMTTGHKAMLSSRTRSMSDADAVAVTWVGGFSSFFSRCRWIQKQDDEELWTEGVEDYIAHANKILKEHDDVLKMPSTNGPAAGSSKPSSNSGFSFGSASQSAATPVFNFAAPKVEQSFSSPSSSVGFSFGATKPANTPSGFSFGAGEKGDVNKAETPQEDDEEDAGNEEAEPSLELESGSANILLKQRIKLMSHDPETKKWKSRGAGTLSIRQAKEASASGSRASFIVFTTDAGRVLLNAPLVKGLKPTTNPKAPKNIVMMLISQVSPEQPEERGLQLFQCASTEAAAELLSKINEFV